MSRPAAHRQSLKTNSLHSKDSQQPPDTTAPTIPTTLPVKMPTLNTTADLIKTFNGIATEMLDIQHLHKTIQEGMETDIQVGDFVITTQEYDSSIFVCDPLFKEKARQETYTNAAGNRQVRHWVEREPMPNPYMERVVNTPKEARMKMTVKADKNSLDAHDERRIKVRKLNLLGWDADKGEYPRQSIPIIFRQRMVDFRQQHGYNLEYYERILADRPAFVNDKMFEQAQQSAAILRRLVSIQPFLAYADDKYGFLVKRRLAMTRIVLSGGGRPDNGAHHVEVVAHDQVKATVSQMMAGAEARVVAGDISFRESIVKEAMKPERVEALVEKHGIDGMATQFEAAVVAVVPVVKKKVIRAAK